MQVTSSHIKQVKRVAKELKDTYPSLKLGQRQDKAAVQELGVRNYHEAIRLYEKWLMLHVQVSPDPHGVSKCSLCEYSFALDLKEDRESHRKVHEQFHEASEALGYSKPIEHILPRESYEQYSFHFWNLSVACVDCNSLKTDNDWASPTKQGMEAYPAPNSFTEMFHPRFHRFDDHVRFIRVQTNDHSVTLYRGITPQGQKLCEDLLNKIAGKEVIVNANADLKSSLETIERFEVEEGSELENALKSLHGALSGRTFELVQSS